MTHTITHWVNARYTRYIRAKHTCDTPDNTPATHPSLSNNCVDYTGC